MIRLVLATALCAGLFCTASAAFAQRDDARLQGVRAELTELQQGLDQAGLPGSWIWDKAREGLAKRAPAARILAACGVLDAQIRAAARLAASLGVPSSPEVLRPMVDALAGGYTELELGQARPELRRIASLDRAEATRIAVGALAELAERGFDKEVSLVAVRRSLAERGADGVRRMMRRARGLRGSAAERSRGLGNPGNGNSSGARPDHSQGMGPPHDVGFGQGRGRGMGPPPGMGPPSTR